MISFADMKRIIGISLLIIAASILAVSCKSSTNKSSANEEPQAAEQTNPTDMNVKIISDNTTPEGVRELSVIPSNVCSSQIDIAVKDGVILNVQYTNGCPGNTHGVSALVKGMKVTEAIERLDGIDCGGKGTSCPDQLARALKYLTL